MIDSAQARAHQIARQREIELDALGDRIAELSAQITAATYHLLLLIREFDERGGWESGYDGFRTCAHWLNWRVGLGLGAAREKVRVARGCWESCRSSQRQCGWASSPTPRSGL